jgi:hypothetical protein
MSLTNAPAFHGTRLIVAAWQGTVVFQFTCNCVLPGIGRQEDIDPFTLESWMFEVQLNSAFREHSTRFEGLNNTISEILFGKLGRDEKPPSQ